MQKSVSTNKNKFNSPSTNRLEFFTLYPPKKKQQNFQIWFILPKKKNVKVEIQKRDSRRLHKLAALCSSLLYLRPPLLWLMPWRFFGRKKSYIRRTCTDIKRKVCNNEKSIRWISNLHYVHCNSVRITIWNCSLKKPSEIKCGHRFTWKKEAPMSVGYIVVGVLVRLNRWLYRVREQVPVNTRFCVFFPNFTLTPIICPGQRTLKTIDKAVGILTTSEEKNVHRCPLAIFC